MKQKNNKFIIEKQSSAITLSDMEVFIFPELIYSLVLANIMSPRIWKWLQDPWFKGLSRLSPPRRIQRLKQYIMDHYTFNLDLDTWGLTTKEKELKRFNIHINTETLKRSNALFGYEGDKHYFDIDIRRHFGLDKYNDNIIPYWKTETIEAMDAFLNKKDFRTGAGECVSLSALYTAALFIVAEIPLEDIYLMATPLHSQNFINIDDGFLTNNRRIVTKNMWFNGTATSTKARRALENEQITIVAHVSGVIHTIYDDASISEDHYNIFLHNLKKFLKIKFDSQILGNFLRAKHEIHECIQLCCHIHGKPHYIGLDRLLEYELKYPYLFTDNTRKKLIEAIDPDEFHTSPIPKRIILNDLEKYIETNPIDFSNPKDVSALYRQFTQDCVNSEILLKKLEEFCITEPKIPDLSNKKFVPPDSPIKINIGMTRKEIIDHLQSIRVNNSIADHAFYAYRDISSTDPVPFIKAAIERNPVSIDAFSKIQDNTHLYNKIKSLKCVSIYDGPYRLAQPDEVYNFSTGDGIEKALLLCNIIRSKNKNSNIRIHILKKRIELNYGSENFVFISNKQIKDQIWEIGKNIRIIQLSVKS